jgi:hypothetical protein
MKLTTATSRILVCLALAFLVFLCANSPTAQAQQVQVNAADPAAAAQGTINLNVKVTGKGFKKGATAKWLVTGTTDPGGVTVNSTTFVSSTELTANITVADTAVIANFDIQVLNSDGRGGKGTELFAITAKGAGSGNSAELVLNVTIEPLAGNCRICPDDSTTPTYMTGVASVNAVFNVDGHFVFLSGSRTVEFLYSTPLGDSLTTRILPNSEEPANVRARTFNTSEPYTNLQDMLIGQQQCLGLGWFIGQFTNSERSIGFRYGRGMLTNTSFVIVQRTDLDNWVMEPAPQTMCSTTFLQDNVTRIRDSETKRGKTTDYDYGRYVMPFKLTLTRQ